MAINDMVVRILGDSRSVERAFARSSNAATQFNRNVETTGRKLDSNAKKFSGFAKGAAAGFGGAVAFNAAINGIRSVALAAAESQQVLGQTRVALESTGKSWEQYGQTITDTVKAQSRLGFDDEALLRTFSQFQRTTGDVTEALRLNNLAMDVARARYIDLESGGRAGDEGGDRERRRVATVGDRREGRLVRHRTADAADREVRRVGGGGGGRLGDGVRANTGGDREPAGVDRHPAAAGAREAGERDETAATFAQNLSDALDASGKSRSRRSRSRSTSPSADSRSVTWPVTSQSKLKFTPLNPLFGLTIANAIADQFRDQTEEADTEVWRDRFAADIGVMTFAATATKETGKVGEDAAGVRAEGVQAAAGEHARRRGGRAVRGHAGQPQPEVRPGRRHQGHRRRARRAPDNASR